MPTKPAVVHSDPEILGGTPVFCGTRVPLQTLFDYLEGSETLDEFLRQFPSVNREQAVAALGMAKETLLALPAIATRSSRCSNLEYQQQLSGRLFGAVIVGARSNRMVHLRPLIPAIREALTGLEPGVVRRVGS